MEDPKTTSSSSSFSLSLPPGFRFYPSEEQLLSYYLSHKNNNNNNINTNPNLYEPIKEISLYNYNPFELPDFTCFRFGFKGRKRHWYCFTESFNEEGETRRRAGIGFWKMKGRVRDVMGSNGGRAILGRRKCFSFYLKKSNGKTPVRTDWFMYEYALIDNFKASFVVCRVFVKSRGRNSNSEHALSSCAEESLGTVRHIGIQHDGSTMSPLNEGNALGCNCVQKVADCTTQFVEEKQPNNLVNSPVHAGSTGMNSLIAWQFASILQGDYIELDDLI